MLAATAVMAIVDGVLMEVIEVCATKKVCVPDVLPQLYASLYFCDSLLCLLLLPNQEIAYQKQVYHHPRFLARRSVVP
ncbi:MAG: hypothetical protein NVSMB33_12200 [Ktedonobacteraceae bacterium]